MSESIDEKSEASPSTSHQDASLDQVEEAMKHLRIRPRKMLEFLSHLRINRARIKPIETQAPKAGGNADVEAAILTPTPPSSSSEPEYVAVKKLRLDTETDSDRSLAVSRHGCSVDNNGKPKKLAFYSKPFVHEVNLLNDLSHSNVVKIIGFVEDADNGVAWVVFTWERNGNLREFVRSENWELPERVSLIHDVAQGLSYLHGRNPPICHGDLKSLNVLVNPKNRAIITDLGSARAIDSATEAVASSVNEAKQTKIPGQTATGTTTMEALKIELPVPGEFITMTGPAWTIRWAAPELLKGELPGLGSDIWALGWICWEVVTGNFPFNEDNDISVIRRIVTKDLPTVSDDAQLKQIKTLCSLIEDCWRFTANERPPALRCQQVVSFMHQNIPFRKGGNSSATARSAGLLHALGWIELRNGVLYKAQEYFRQSLEISDSVGDEDGKARAMTAIGQAYYLQSKHSEAEESYIRSRDLSFKIGDQLGVANAVKALGEVYRMRAEYSKAEESNIHARDLYSSLGHQLGFAHSVCALGDVYWMRHEYSKAEESYIQSRDLYSEIGEPLGFAQSVKALGDVYRMRDEYSKAEESYIQSRDLYSNIGDQLGFAHSVRALGEVYHMRKEYSEAEESYIQSRDVYSKIGERLGFAHSVDALGDVYRMKGEYSKAEESYIQSRGLYSKIGNQLGFSNSVKSLGDVYLMQGEYSKAEESYIQSRDLCSKIGNELGFANSLQRLGQVHSARGEYVKARQSYLEAQRIYHRIGDRYSSANISWYLAWLYRKQAQYEEAERLVQEASTIYAQLDLTEEVAACDEFMVEIVKQRGRGWGWGWGWW